MIKLAVITLLTLTGPDNQRIDVASSAIVSLREPRGQEHFAPGIKCLLHMSDGKIVTVTETCETVRIMMQSGEQE